MKHCPFHIIKTVFLFLSLQLFVCFSYASQEKAYPGATLLQIMDTGTQVGPWHFGMSIFQNSLYVTYPTELTFWTESRIIKVNLTNAQFSEILAESQSLYGLTVDQADSTVWVGAPGSIRHYSLSMSLIESKSIGFAGFAPGSVIVHGGKLFLADIFTDKIFVINKLTLEEENNFAVLPELSGSLNFGDMTIFSDKLYVVSPNIVSGFVRMNLDGSEQEFIPVETTYYKVAAIGIYVQDEKVFLNFQDYLTVTDFSGNILNFWWFDKPEGFSGAYKELEIFDNKIYIASYHLDEGNTKPPHVLVYKENYWPKISFPDSLVFGKVNDGSSVEQILTISNTGDTTLSVLNITLEENFADEFSLFPASFNIEPAQFQEVTLKFAPVSPGEKSTLLMVHSNDPVIPSGQVVITGTGLNQPPVADDKSIIINEDTESSITLFGDDLESETLLFAVERAPANGKINLNGEVAVYTPDPDFSGEDNFSFTVSDGQAVSAPATVSIVIIPVNDPPVLDEIGNRTAEEAEQMSILLLASDVEEQEVTFSVTDSPTGSSLSGPVFTWTPTFGQAGDYSVTFTVEDESGESATETVTISVVDIPPPEGPVYMDFNLADGDQEKRRAGNAVAEKTYELQLCVEEAPEISGWSATIEYDPKQVRYVNGSFKASDFIPGLMILANEKEGSVEIGGTVLGSDASNSGNGVLGTLSFEVLEGLTDSTDIVISAIRLRRTDGVTDKQMTWAVATITTASVFPGDFDGDGKVDFTDFFLFADAFGGTDPIYDLDSSGQVDFNDFFIFADNFGKDAQAKLMVLAQEYLGLPVSPYLEQNYPNPFNSQTTIRFALPSPASVELAIFNLAGQQVATLVSGKRQAGTYTIQWDSRDDNGSKLASGVYLYRLQAGQQQVETRKLVLLR